MSNKTQLLIKGGTVVNHDYVVKSDVLIENGKIIKIENDIEVDENCEVINANNNYIIPGGVDAETYLNAERSGVSSVDSYSNGTKSAILGGTTTIINNIEIVENEDIKTRLDSEMKLIEKECHCNVALQLCLPVVNESYSKQLLDILDSEDPMLPVVPAVRLSTVTKGQRLIGLEDDALYDALCWCRDHDILPSVIAENDKLIKSLEKEMIDIGIKGPEAHYLSRNERTEEEAVQRVLTISKLAHCPVLLSRVFSANSAQLLNKWKIVHPQSPAVACATNVLALTHTARLLLDGEQSWSRAASGVSVPALKLNSAPGVMLAQLGGGLIGHVSSAHLQFHTKHRAAGGQQDFRLIVPATSCALSARMRLVWNQAVKTGEMSASRFVECTSTMPAKLCGLYPQKGTISVGSDADLVIWSESDYSSPSNDDNLVPDLFSDVLGKAGPKYVIIAGQIKLDSNGELKSSTEEKAMKLAINRHGLSNWFDQARLQMHLEWTNNCPIITREAYTGPVVSLDGLSTEKCILYSDMVDKEVYQRGKAQEPHKEALPPGQRIVRTSVKTAQPPGGTQSSWWG